MPQFNIITASREGVIVYSFTTGSVRNKRTFRIKNENDALAYAMWLERRDRGDEAISFLEEWINKNCAD